MPIVTESLGFVLRVLITFEDTKGEFRGHHVSYTHDGAVSPEAHHKLIFSLALRDEELAEVIGHEVYHLIYSVRPLITADEEIQAEVFGQLIKHCHLVSKENHHEEAKVETTLPTSFEDRA